MTSGIGNNRGFTLIEVLLAVSILGIGLAGILGVYQDILGSFKRARLLTDGLNLLEEKMTDRELEIRGGGGGGSSSGKEGLWSWSTQTLAGGREGFYEIEGKVEGTGMAQAITLTRYVRRSP